MCNRMCNRMCNKVVLVLLATICTVTVVSGQNTRTYFKCYTDVCNVNDQDQFCSERERKCRNCLEIVDSCFDPGLPSNCTRTCLEFHLKKAKESECQVFAPIKNGRINGSSLELYSQGDVISVTCDAGYRVSGRHTLECKAYGQWSHDLPTCEEITCPALISVHNGKHNGSQTNPNKPGDVVTVQCNPGYQRIGPETTTCNSNGAWQNQLSICQKYPDVPLIRNGKLHRQMSKNGQESDVIDARCDSGYSLEGRATFRWSMTESWDNSNGHIPVCIKDEVINVWMIAAIVEGIMIIIMFIIILGKRYHCPLSRRSASRKSETNATPFEASKENGSKDETAVLIEKEVNTIKPPTEHKFQNRDIVSLHDQKIQREGSAVSNSSKGQHPKLPPIRPLHNADSSIQNDSLTNTPSVETPGSCSSNQQRDPRAQNRSAETDGAASREKDNQSNTSMSYEQSGRKPESGNNMTFNININSDNSNNNSNKLVCNGTDNLLTKQTDRSSPRPGTAETKDVEMNDLKEEELKSPIEESATFQPSHPQESPDSDSKTVATTCQQESKGGANTNEDSGPSFRPVNGLAVQQSANNEQDTARKLAMPNGDLNTDDVIQRTQL